MSDRHPDSTLAWLQVAEGDKALCFHCREAMPCAAYVSRHAEGDEHRSICLIVGCRYRSDEP